MDSQTPDSQTPGSQTSLELAYSPCPNDTFIFHAWSHGLIPGPSVNVTHADIDVTNTAAADGRFDVVKVSYAALPWLLETYRLLPCGGALGRGCGPLVLTRGRTGPASPRSATIDGSSAADSSLDGLSVAIPSDRSTAYLLFRLWAAGHHPSRIETLPFAQIMPAVRDGIYDAGLVIHEARFTYRQYGLTALIDLGEWWESQTGLPIPLGAILARRSLDADMLTETIRASLDYAWANPTASAVYVAEHADEMSPEVQAAHIKLYVNEFSRDLGDEGYAAAKTLLDRAAANGLVPPIHNLRS